MDNVKNPNLKFRVCRHGHLPTEVEENVIDHCADDLTTLRQCALTCRDWLPRSRFHLLSAVLISTQESMYSFCDHLDAHPDWRTLVRSITMAPSAPEKKPACLVGTFPIPLLSRLPQLRRWKLRNDPSTNDSNVLKVCYHARTLYHLRTSSPIVDLHLQGLNFVSRYEFLRFITSFSQLKYLQCDTIGFDRPDSLHSGRPKPRNLSKLCLSTLLMRHVSQDVLRTLLESTTSSLESLTVTPSEVYSKGQGSDGAVLSRMSMLHSLTFEIRDRRHVIESLQGWDTMAEALHGAHPSQLKSLTVNMSGHPLLLYRDVAHSLASTILEMNLQSFTINIDGHQMCSKHPIADALLLMEKFVELCEEGQSPEVVFTNLDATFFEEQLSAECTATSPDGRWVARSINGGAVLWDVMSNHTSARRTWRLPPVFPLRAGSIRHLVFSPGGGRLLLIGAETAACVWDVKKRCHVHKIKCDSNVVAGTWSPRCIVLVTEAFTISTYDPSTYQPMRDHMFADRPSRYMGNENHYPSLLFSPDSRWMAMSCPGPANWYTYTWTIWRVCGEGDLTRHSVLSRTGEAFGALNNYCGHHAAFNSESTRMAVVRNGLELHVWEVATTTLLISIDLATRGARSVYSLSVAFSTDGQHLLMIRNWTAMIEVWEAATGRFIRELVLEGQSRDDIRYPSFSSCGSYVISSSFSARGALVWRAEDGSFVNRNS